MFRNTKGDNENNLLGKGYFKRLSRGGLTVPSALLVDFTCDYLANICFVSTYMDIHQRYSPKRNLKILDFR